MTRLVNVRYSNYDVYIGRGNCPKTGKPGIWGNPFSWHPNTPPKYRVSGRTEAIERYREWIQDQGHLLRQLKDLKGKTLSCWCKPLSCHGDVLIELIELFTKEGII